jgi:hypothetical protein
LRKNEKNVLVEMCPPHYNRRLSADRAGLREERGSHSPGAAAEGGRDYGAAAAAQDRDGCRATAAIDDGHGLRSVSAAQDGHEHRAAAATEDGHKHGTAGETGGWNAGKIKNELF